MSLPSGSSCHPHTCVLPIQTCVFHTHTCVDGQNTHVCVWNTHVCVLPIQTCVFHTHTCVFHPDTVAVLTILSLDTFPTHHSASLHLSFCDVSSPVSLHLRVDAPGGQSPVRPGVRPVVRGESTQPAVSRLPANFQCIQCCLSQEKSVKKKRNLYVAVCVRRLLRVGDLEKEIGVTSGHFRGSLPALLWMQTHQLAHRSLVNCPH